MNFTWVRTLARMIDRMKVHGLLAARLVYLAVSQVEPIELLPGLPCLEINFFRQKWRRKCRGRSVEEEEPLILTAQGLIYTR